jgi:hypothetical protein
MDLYILGGSQRRRYLRPADAERRFERAVVLRLDTDTDASRPVIQYHTPCVAKAHPDSSDLFTSGTLHGSRLYVCTYTEVLVYELSNFSQRSRISLPCFNSIHHVCPTRRASLLVANTGLDMVLEITLDGTVLREWNVLGEKPWGRYSRDVDYRKISTKPHLSHPNFVFELFDEVWATRFCQRDAICLTRPIQQIRIDVERPHDGLVHDGLIYFTTVDGHLVIIDSASLKTFSIVDLKQFRDYPFSGPAWCRGILVISPNLVCVGFTRIRKTVVMQTANWIKHGFREVDAPTHVAIFDLAERQCLKAIDLEPCGINILFGILDAGAKRLDSTEQ